MAPHNVRNFFFASGLSHANGHVKPFQRCVDVDVEGNAETLNFIQEAGSLQNSKQKSPTGEEKFSLCKMSKAAM